MDFLPWSTFTRIVARYDGDQRVRTLSCAEHYRAMAFAQLTYRESLRDIETCLSVQASKLYSMGFREPVRRSTLADANEARDWRIYAELAQRLIVHARRLYANEDLANTVYALDSTTIDLCLAVFRGRISARPRRRSRCIRCWTCAATSRASSTFRTANCTMFARSTCCFPKRVRSTSWIAAMSILPGSTCCILPEPSSSLAPNRTWMPIGSIRPRQTGRPVSSAIRPLHWMVTTPASTIPNTCGASA